MPTDVKLRGDPILRRIPRGPAIVVEVGVFVGTLSRYLVQKHQCLRLIAVDSWAPERLQPKAYRATGDRHALMTAQQCTMARLSAKNKLQPFKDRVTIMAMTSVEAARKIRDWSVDLVFLDGDHSEAGVTADIEAWEQKARPGGYLGGHDYGHRSGAFAGVRVAVDAWAAGREIERDTDNTWFFRL